PTQLSANDRFRLNLTKARAALELKPAQEPSWESYANAALAAYEKTSPQATALLEQATKALYSVLSSGQQSAADRVLAATRPPYPGLDSEKAQAPFAGSAGGNDR